VPLKTRVIPPLFIEVSVPSQENERLYVYVCSGFKSCLCFFLFSIGLLNCSHGVAYVVLYVFEHYLIYLKNNNKIRYTLCKTAKLFNAKTLAT